MGNQNWTCSKKDKYKTNKNPKQESQTVSNAKIIKDVFQLFRSYF